MNKKAETEKIVGFVALVVGIIVGLIIIQAASDNAVQVTNILDNQTGYGYGNPGINNASSAMVQLIILTAVLALLVFIIAWVIKDFKEAS